MGAGRAVRVAANSGGAISAMEFSCRVLRVEVRDVGATGDKGHLYLGWQAVWKEGTSFLWRGSPGMILFVFRLAEKG